MLNNPYVLKGGSNINNITGTLTDPNGQPVSSKTQIVLQYAKPNDNTWSMRSPTITLGPLLQIAR